MKQELPPVLVAHVTCPKCGASCDPIYAVGDATAESEALEKAAAQFYASVFSSFTKHYDKVHGKVEVPAV